MNSTSKLGKATLCTMKTDKVRVQRASLRPKYKNDLNPKNKDNINQKIKTTWPKYEDDLTQKMKTTSPKNKDDLAQKLYKYQLHIKLSYTANAYSCLLVLVFWGEWGAKWK